MESVERNLLKTGDEREARQKAREIIDSIDKTQSFADVVNHAAIDKGIIDKEQIAQISTVVDRKSRKKIQLNESWKCYLESHDRPDTGPATLIEYKRYWKRFTDWATNNISPDLSMHEITIDESRQFASELQKDQKMGPATYNKYIRFCRLCFKVLAYEAGVTKNPFEGIASRNNNSEGKRELTKKELNAIDLAIKQSKEAELEAINTQTRGKLIYQYRSDLNLESSNNFIEDLCEFINSKWDQIKLLFSIGCFTGLRLKDACLLKWDQVDLNRKLISLLQQTQKRWKREMDSVTYH